VIGVKPWKMEYFLGYVRRGSALRVYREEDVMNRRIVQGFGAMVLLMALCIAPHSLAQLQESVWPTYQHDLQRTGRTMCVGPATADTLWTFVAGDYCQSSPAIAEDGTIYIGSHNDSLHALNPDGTQKWACYLGGTVWSSPAIGADGTIYVGSYDDNFYAVDSDGNVKWSIPMYANVSSSPAISPDGVIYVGSGEDSLYAIEDSVTYGYVRWKLYVSDMIMNSSPAIAHDGTIYVGAFSDSLFAVEDSITYPNVKWTYYAGGNIWAAPTVGEDGTVYVGSYSDEVHAINPDGSLKWTFLTAGYVNCGAAIGWDGTIYVGSNDDSLYALRDLGDHGERVWAFPCMSTVQSSPAVDGKGYIYFGSHDNDFYCLNPDGTVRWSFHTAHNVYSSPAIGEDGTIYFGGQDNHVYAIGPGGGCAGVVVQIVPEATELTPGDDLIYTMVLWNRTDQWQRFKLGSLVKLPNGHVYGPVLGPEPITLLPSGEMSGTIVHAIPGKAMEGDYTYTVKIGTSQTDVWDFDSFQFTVVVP
jgi:outer membrane protein assembly factor BamB